MLGRNPAAEPLRPMRCGEQDLIQVAVAQGPQSRVVAPFITVPAKARGWGMRQGDRNNVPLVEAGVLLGGLGDRLGDARKPNC